MPCGHGAGSGCPVAPCTTPASRKERQKEYDDFAREVKQEFGIKRRIISFSYIKVKNTDFILESREDVRQRGNKKGEDNKANHNLL